MKFNIRLLYLYLFSFVGLLIMVIGGARLVDLGLKTFVFKEADKYEIYSAPIKDGSEVQISREEQLAQQEREMKRNHQRELSGSISMIVIGLPLYWYHWRTIKKEQV